MNQNKFDVYFNLHKKLFSLKNYKTKLVTGHSNEVKMQSVTFKVSEAGRLRVLKEQRKNVHAYVRGEVITSFANEIDSNWVEITYNPYKYSTFVIKETQVPVFTAKMVLLKDKKIFAIL